MNNKRIKYDINIVNKRIKEIRKLRNLTQQELADKIGVQRQALTNWERKTNNTLPSLENLVILCEVLECSLDYLVGSVDIPEISVLSKAYHYSRIKPEIIKAGWDDPNFLDCINFFMHPQNSADIFNSTALAVLKNYLIESSIEEITDDLKEKILLYYEEYISATPFESINEKTYGEFLKEKFPFQNISYEFNKTENKIYLKKCVSRATYQNFFEGEEFNYSSFINYLVKHTFKPLSQKMILEIQINKLTHQFTELLMKYLREE